MSEKSLLNKVIIVTGGSGGIGSAIVERLSESGARVVSVYCNNYPINNSRENETYFKADLTSPGEWDKLISYVKKTHDKIDVLINCAGYLEAGSFLSLGEDKIKKMIEINLTSVIIGTHKTLKVFRGLNTGQIINIGSLGGIVPMPYSSIYCSTKFALRGFTLSLAEELKGTGIDISLISAGSVITKMLTYEALDEHTAMAFVGKPLFPGKVADCVLRVILKPCPEVIIPASQSILSRMLSFSPSVFSRLYIVLHRIGNLRKTYYINRYCGSGLNGGRIK